MVSPSNWRVVRDHHGRFIFGFFEFIGDWPILYTELFAIWRAIQWIPRFNILNICVRTDCLTVVHISKKKENIQWLCMALVLQIQSITHTHNIQFSHIYKEGNKATDYMTNKGISTKAEEIWTYPFQDDTLRGILRSDALPFIHRRPGGLSNS